MTDKATDVTVTHPISMLREMLASAIKREGTTHSFMIRAGLLADLLDELGAHRTASEQSASGAALRSAAQAVLDNANRPGSRMHFEGGPNGEDVWVDHQEVDQPVLDALAAALSTTSEAPAQEDQQ